MVVAKDNGSSQEGRDPFGLHRVLLDHPHCRGLFAHRFEPFCYTVERRQERALIEDYREGILRILDRLTPATLSLAVDYARVAESIRGYGHIKAASVEAAHKRFAAIEAAFEATTKTI